MVKNMNLLKELTEDYTVEAIPLMEAISRAVRELKMQKPGGKVNNKMVKDFIKNNKALTTSAAAAAVASYQQFKTNRQHIISFFAKTAFERKEVKAVVQQLLKGKQYKIHRKTRKNGGDYYELKRVKSGF